MSFSIPKEVLPPGPIEPYGETVQNVAAITAGTLVARNFVRTFAMMPYPYRTSLTVDNRSATRIILHCNGQTRNVASGAVLTVTSKELGGPIYGYALDAAANTNASEVDVYENGGLNVPE